MKGKALLTSAAKRKEICVFKWHIYSVSTQEQPNQNGILTFDSRDNICWCFGATWDPWNEYNFIMEARGDWIIDDYVSFACIFRMEEAQKNLVSTKSRWRYWTCIPESKSNPYKTLFLFIRFIFVRQHLCVFLKKILSASTCSGCEGGIWVGIGCRQHRFDCMLRTERTVDYAYENRIRSEQECCVQRP